MTNNITTSPSFSRAETAVDHRRLVDPIEAGLREPGARVHPSD